MTYLAVFDWNGTLFDDTEATLHADNEVLAFFGRPPIDIHTLRETFTFPLIHAYERLGVGADEYLARAEEAAEVFTIAYDRHAQSAQIAEGAFDLLDWLNSYDVHTMILSNYLQHLLEGDTDRLGITPHMNYISGNTEWATITHGLSKQTRLEAYMAENGFVPEKTFIIGDSHEEPDVARRLGLLGISLTGGLMSRARLEKHKADYIVEKLHEVRPILEKHWKL